MKSSVKKYFLLLTSTALIVACNQTSPSNSKEDNSSSASQVSSDESSMPSSSSTTSYSSVDTNPYNCSIHVLEDTVTKEATLIEKGVKHFTCPNCHAEFDDYYYKMDEFVFDDMTFMDDNQEHQITIDGVLPYGVSVTYENNTLKGVGHKEATAKFFDEHNNQIMEKKATLNIIENIGLPNIRITTADGEDPDYKSYNGQKKYKGMSVTIDNCDSKYAISEENKLTGEMKVRGNSTNQESVAKRAFRLKFSGKSNLLGLNNGAKCKSWVLLADFFDQSYFRNESAFIMGNALFNYSGYYSSDFKHVVLYMNGENRGVYLLAEQQQANKNRINIAEPEDDYAGTDVGYLIEIDGLVTQKGNIDSKTHIGEVEGDPCFTTGTGSSSGFGGWGGFGGGDGDSINGVTIQDKGYVVKTDTYGEEQVPFIRDYMNNVLTAFKDLLKGKDKQIVDETGALKPSTFTTQYETLNAYIDLDSFFRMYVLQEFMKDYDVGWGSFYMYVDFSASSKAKRLTMAAPWDFDLGEGNKTSGDIVKANDNFLNNSSYANGMTTANPWLYMLSQTDFFQEMFKKYYSVFDKSGIFERVQNNIQYERVAFKNAFDDNEARYGKGSSGATLMQTRQYDSHKDAVDYLVKWFNDRKTYLDKTWAK